jgi:hypothetical protein
VPTSRRQKFPQENQPLAWQRQALAGSTGFVAALIVKKSDKQQQHLRPLQGER